MSSTEESKTVATSFYEAYSGDDLRAAFDTYIAQDLVNHTMGGAMDRELWMQSDIAGKAAMPDQTMTILGQAADGEKVFTHWVLEGTHTGGDFMGQPASGRTIRLEAVAVDVVRGGQIVEHNAVGDFTALMAQVAGE
jgi:predicted ester cyclase